MIRKVTDIEVNKETIEGAMKWSNNGASLGKVLGESPKYFVIDWRNADIEKLKTQLQGIDKYLIADYICDNQQQVVNNVEALFAMYQYIETKNEEYLWCAVVDNGRYISHDLYCKNTYRENFNILIKMTKFILPL